MSTLDYANHLDRQVHDISCSYVPGVTAAQGADEGCRAAMYSPYAALLREQYWGGIPISLLAVGAFAFFAAFGLYLLLAARTAPRRAAQFIALLGATPLAASIVMAVIAATRLGQFCKTCVGIYAASAVLAAGGLAVWLVQRRERAGSTPVGGAEAGSEAVAQAGGGQAAAWSPRPLGRAALVLGWLAALGAFAAFPGFIYASSVPSYDKHLRSCGALKQQPKVPTDFVRLSSRTARVPATLVIDPLCRSCKALHQRLEFEGFLDRLDLLVVPFPLDSTCNWMLEQPLHPGACELSKAMLCGEHRAEQVLAWAYDNQDALLAATKGEDGRANVQAAIARRWPELADCVKAKKTARRLDRVMRFAVENRLPVSTPQLFVAGQRVCDEDTDMGLSYALPRLAPELRAP